ncbi:MAG: sigma-54 dependent transcriptional regulator [Pseudomonadota bacterium]
MSKARIVILDKDRDSAERLRDLLAAGNWPAPSIATPDSVQSGAGADEPLSAVVLGQSLSDVERDSLKATLSSRAAAIVNVAGVPDVEQSSNDPLALPWPPSKADISRTLRAIESTWADSGSGEQGPRLTGVSDAIEDVRTLLNQVSTSDATVIITGESGTGKEVAACQIHSLSNRASGPFVAVNCGAIPAELIESELFGHVKGAFTGALQNRKGKFVQADGGTLFLDEVGDMPLDLQVKLLRVLQERRVEPVGSSRSVPIDVRIIAATNRTLPDEVEANRFREDLYYRLNVFPVEMPPLRERRKDIPALVEEFRAANARRYGVEVSLADDALDALTQYHWPGNIRELSNVMERLAVSFPDRPVTAADLPLGPAAGREKPAAVTDSPAATPKATTDSGTDQAAALQMEGVDLKNFLTQVERNLIEQALARSNGVIARAAKLLQMQRTTLVEKMRRYEIVAADYATQD